MSPSPELHSALLLLAAIASVLLSGLLVARSPRFTAPGIHALYGGVLAWWLFCMSSLATSASEATATTWARLAHLGICLIPAVVYHLNAATAGLLRDLRRGIRVHYALSIASLLLCVATPLVLAEPRRFAWGWYPSYTAWGLVPIGLLVVTLFEVLWIYARALRSTRPGSAYHETLLGVHWGNAFASLTLVDFLPIYGIAVYPFAYLVVLAGQVANLYGSLRDRLIEITPQFAAEQILRTIPDGVFAVDSRGWIRFANQAAARILGGAREELVDQPIERAVRNPTLRKAFELAPVQDAPVQEIELEDDSGAPRFLRIAGAPLRVRPDQPLAHVWVLHDLTDQRLAEAEGEKLSGWIERSQKLETLGVMAGGIAHDFNNLLTVILGAAEMARDEADREHRGREHFETITVAGERAAELTGQMLAYAGRGSTSQSALDLNALCRKMLELIRAAVSKKARLDLQLADELPPVVGDPSQLSQIVLNLLTNASEALGDEPGRISLRTGQLRGEALGDGAGQFVFIEVEDDGCGMDPATRRRIFDPFFTTKFTGRGLGLATVIGIVESHGGRLRVQTEPGQGSRFTVALPAAPHESIRDAEQRPDSGPWRGSGLALLADDEPEVRGVLRGMLERLGYEVIEAGDGLEAIAAFRQRGAEIRLAVLDSTMPGSAGLDVLREVRAQARNLPVVLISGYEAVGSAALEEDPHTVFLQKPFDLAALRERVSSVAAPAGVDRS